MWIIYVDQINKSVGGTCTKMHDIGLENEMPPDRLIRHLTYRKWYKIVVFLMSL